VCVSGNCYLNGIGVAKDEVEALAYFVRGSELNYAPSQYQIGIIFMLNFFFSLEMFQFLGQLIFCVFQLYFCCISLVVSRWAYLGAKYRRMCALASQIISPVFHSCRSGVVSIDQTTRRCRY
jgi:TPR repeat protein